MYLLDTNHCSRLLQGHPHITQKLQTIDHSLVTTCAIVQGELLFMAERSEHRDANLRNIRAFLSNLRIYAIDGETASIYGQLKAALLAHYSPKDRAKRRKTNLHRLGFSDNDLWIAAVALQQDITVVSADRDFDRIAIVESLSIESWWHPQLD